MLTAENHGGYRTRCHAAVHDQYDRRLQQLGKLRRAVTSLSVHAIEKTPVALHQCAIGLPHTGGKGRDDPLPFHQEEIQIMAGLTRCHFKPGSIDIIGTLFKRGYRLSPAAKASPHAHGQEGLSRISSQSGENYPWTVYNHFSALSPIVRRLPFRAGCRHP